MFNKNPLATVVNAQWVFIWESWIAFLVGPNRLYTGQVSMSSAFHLHIEKCQREWDQLILIELHQILFWLFAYTLKQQRWTTTFYEFLLTSLRRGKEKCPIFAGQLDCWKCQAHRFSHSLFNQLKQYRSKLLWHIRPLHSKKDIISLVCGKGGCASNHWLSLAISDTSLLWRACPKVYGLVLHPLPTPPSRLLHLNHGIEKEPLNMVVE